MSAQVQFFLDFLKKCSLWVSVVRDMRYHLFLHYGSFLQNLDKDFIQTNMYTTVFCQIICNPQKQCALLLLLSSKSYANIASINIIAGQELQGHFTSDVYHKYLLNIQITLHCKSIYVS